MKRTLTLALGLAFSAGLVLPALAQDNFPDVPENHWAYEALRNMKAAGLLVGYPDGLFRGGRPASRYEMAVAIHATYQNLKSLIDGVEAQRAALQTKVDAMQGASPDEVRALRDQLTTIQAAIDGMKSWGDDIANLKRMAGTFEKELASMGVDVEAVKKGLSELAERVGALEKRKLPVNISGDVNLLVLGGYSDDDFGITVDGRPTGVSRDGSFRPTGATQDLSIFHEAALTLSGTNEEGPRWKATLVAGNLLSSQGSDIDSFDVGNGGTGFGSFTGVLPGVPFGEESGDIYIQNLQVGWDTQLFGQGFNVTIGRIGAQVGSYFLKRADNTPYFENARWDDGNVIFDGALLQFKFGKAGLNLFGGRNTSRLSNNGTELSAFGAGNYGPAFVPGQDRPRGYGNVNGILIDQHLGANLSIPLSDKGGLNLNYLIFDANDTTTLGSSPTLIQANRAVVFGGEVNFMFNNLKVKAGYSQSNLNNGDSAVVDEDNTAIWGSVGYEGSRWGVKAGYRQILPNFYAPGDWGRIGIWWNPTDIEGFSVGGNFNFSDKLKLNASGEFLTGTETEVGGIMGLTKDDKITSIKAELDYNINEFFGLTVGGEFVQWDLEARGLNFAGGEPKETWYTLGLRYNMAQNSFLRIMWQISDYDSDGLTSFRPFSGLSNNEAKGGLLTTQLSIRF